MELKNLKDFYEKQTYINWDDTQKKNKTELQKRISELTFFVNIASFSIILAVMTYFFVPVINALFAVPLALAFSFICFTICKKGISKIIKIIMK